METTKRIRVAIVTTHPIQYQVPWFKALHSVSSLELKVYYACLPDQSQQGVGFGIPFAWDIPLMEGYEWEVLPNKVGPKGLGNFMGVSTPAICQKLKIDRPDVVIITGWNLLPLVQALIACIWAGIPRIVRAESNALRKRPLLVRLLHRFYLSFFYAYLAIGKANRQFYANYNVLSDRIFSCNYFVDNMRFQNQSTEESQKRNELRRKWNIPEGSTCFLFAGKLEPKKRIMDILEALKSLNQRIDNIWLLAVGTGELLDQAKHFVSEHALPVTFAGFLNQSEIARAYVASDCLVLPSDYGETWGLVVNEAMACGLPAIVSDRVGCGPDLVEDGVTGYIFPCADIGALADRLAAIAAEKEKRLEMGQNARERIKKYSVAKAVEGTLQAIDYVLGQKR